MFPASEPFRLLFSLAAFRGSAMLAVLAVFGNSYASAAEAPHLQVARPGSATLLVITQGASLAPEGREICDWEYDLVGLPCSDGSCPSPDESLCGRLEVAGRQVHVMFVTWPSMGGNAQPARRVADRVCEFLSTYESEWNVVLIGHSRGAIFNQEVAERLGRPRGLGRLLHVMLDPTAALPMGDLYPSTVPANVDRAVVYDDGNAFLSSDVVTDTRPIAGAEHRRIDVDAAGYGEAGTHGGLACWYAAEGFAADLDWLLAESRMGHPSSYEVVGRPYETVAAEVGSSGGDFLFRLVFGSPVTTTATAP